VFGCPEMPEVHGGLESAWRQLIVKTAILIVYIDKNSPNLPPYLGEYGQK